jgi:glycosyltransferase involved in cell wall biosynthesis
LNDLTPAHVSEEKRIRLLVVSSVLPHVLGSTEAANIVVHSILSELARSDAFELTYAYINTTPATLPSQAQSEIDALQAAGVRFLKHLIIAPNPPLRKRPLLFLRAMLGHPESILAGQQAGDELTALMHGRHCEAVLTIWTEIGLNAASDFPGLRFAYHGNPDHKVFDAQYETMRLAGMQPRGISAVFNWIRRTLISSLLERAHLSVLRRFEFVADVAANDAAYYAKNGVNAFYLRNMWPMQPLQDWEARRDALEAANPGKITGSVGNMSATGNSLGFLALTQEVLPALKRKLGTRPFEIHLFGGREPKPFLKPLLKDPHINLRGFVEDLDAEIMSSPVFLISNNHHKFKVGHTRFLHAWSLGACVVAFADCRESMPEIEHGYNALLGKNAEEVAGLVAQALADRSLRRQIGRGGVETLKAQFSPPSITHALIDRMQAAIPFNQSTS